ncbi:MAG: hypothetical protein ACRDOL_39590 [Streptosporangiaceae bacterium]
MSWYAELARAYFTRWLPQWYEQIEDPDRFFAEVGEELARQVDELADDLAAQARPGEGYLEQAARLFRARAQATEIVLRERVLLAPASADGEDEDEDEENDAPPGSGERPMVVNRDHPSWAEVNAGQRERIGNTDGREAL